jgi:hypothetical protein
MKWSAKTRRFLLIGLVISVLAIGGLLVVDLERLGEFERAEGVKGYWASLQEFVKQNGHYPKDDKEFGAFFHMTPEELKQAPVEYVALHDNNADEVVLWCKPRTIFGVRIGITESGEVVKK